MATKHTSIDRLFSKLAALAIGAMLLAACGSTSQALSGSSLATSNESTIRVSVIRDPENPYWRLSNVPADTYADPARGDR